MSYNLTYPLVRKLDSSFSLSLEPSTCKRSRIGATALASCAAVHMMLLGVPAFAQEVSPAVHHDVSGPLHAMARPPLAGPKHEKPLFRLSHPVSNQSDPVVQTSAGPLVGTSPGGLNFAGVGQGDYGFVPNAAPPDTEGTVGATQYVQWVNESFAVFNKATGALVEGPMAGNSVWSGFGGTCETDNNGDPIVQYDKANQRWIFTQFALTKPYLQCVAVSTTSDATGSYNRYSFAQPNFPDYPKLAVWPDAYYISFNMFSGNTFLGGRACAFDSAAMRAGNPATQVCFQLSNTFGGLLPADLDGSNPPPAGSPNFFVAYGTNSLDLWKFHADFVTPANSTFTGPTNIPVAAFSPVCGGGTCIPQAGTTNQLDSLADRLMYRLAYRNFGDHEALVANHSVTAGSGGGVRWYELRNPPGNTMAAGTPVVYQQGTYAPDSDYRWMGSIAMDQAGDIALGYSVSGSIFPSIRYTGRVPATTIDPLGTMEAENTILGGGGAQTGGLSRWGDYSAMTIDPVDDCTFFYTTEYLKSSGSFNWSTRIASFKFPGCGTPQVLTSITVSPSSASVPTGGQKQFSATAYDQNHNPMSTQPTFTWSVGVGDDGSINPTSGLFTAGATVGGATVTASSGSVTSNTASVTVTAAPVLTTITVSPSSASVQTGKTQQFTATGKDQFGSPMNPQPAFAWSVSGGGTINSGLFTAGSVAGGPFTVTASSTGVNGTASVTVTDFTISALPASHTIRRGSNSTYSVTVGALDGFTGVVALSASNLPSRVSASFNPSSVNGSGGSTMTVTVNRKATTGTYTLHINGTSGSLSHTYSVTLVIQ